MEKKENQSQKAQRVQEAILLFRQLSPEKREEILRMIEEKKQTAEAVCLVPQRK